MIGTMRLCMTVQAVLAEHQRRRHTAGQSIAISRETRMSRLRVTALAEHRSAHRKHARVIRAVRIVAVAAIFRDRRMFPKIRAAFFGVAIKAGVVKRLLCELPFARITMRAVASAAAHFALANWVCIRLQ